MRLERNKSSIEIAKDVATSSHISHIICYEDATSVFEHNIRIYIVFRPEKLKKFHNDQKAGNLKRSVTAALIIPTREGKKCG